MGREFAAEVWGCGWNWSGAGTDSSKGIVLRSIGNWGRQLPQPRSRVFSASNIASMLSIEAGHGDTQPPARDEV
jgi:hypothetical protein